MLKKSMAALMASVLLVSFPGTALAGDPVPGLDVKLGKNPGGGGNLAQTKTGRDGRFVFDNLTRGSYRLHIRHQNLDPAFLRRLHLPGTPAARSMISTTRSNIKHTVAAVNGVQVVTIAAEMGMGDASSDVMITAARGRIVGTVTRARLIGGDYGR